METAKINKEQIERLYRFTREHFVEFYDLQTELVDHLAHDIESQWTENPEIDFEEALNKAFKKFGVFGFMDVVEERQKVLSKRYHKLILKHVKAFFEIPQMIGTLGAMCILYGLSKYSPVSRIGLAVLLVVGGMFFFTVLIKKLKKHNKSKNSEQTKKWMFEEIINGYTYSASTVMVIPVQVLIHTDRIYESQSNVLLLFWSIFIVLYFLFNYIVIYVIPSKAEMYLKEVYPEYNMAKM